MVKGTIASDLARVVDRTVVGRIPEIPLFFDARQKHVVQQPPPPVFSQGRSIPFLCNSRETDSEVLFIDVIRRWPCSASSAPVALVITRSRQYTGNSSLHRSAVSDRIVDWGHFIPKAFHDCLEKRGYERRVTCGFIAIAELVPMGLSAHADYKTREQYYPTLTEGDKVKALRAVEGVVYGLQTGTSDPKVTPMGCFERDSEV